MMSTCRPHPRSRTGTLPVTTLTPPEFEICGPARSPVIAALGGISADRHLTATAGDPSPGWWQALIGPGRAIDTDRHRVLGIDWLTAIDRPVTTADQADGLARVMDHLAIDRLEAIVGASYGGMVALAFAVRYPTRVGRLVVLSAAHAPHPMATAHRVLQRRIVQLGLLAGVPTTGIAIARGLGITTYRSAGEFAERFAVEPRWVEDVPRFPVEEYLEHGGRTFAARFDARRYLSLSESLDLHGVDPGAITTPTTLFGVVEDQLVPLWQLRELRDRHGGECRLHEAASRYGHDAFLKEIETVGGVVHAGLGEGGRHGLRH